MDKLCQAATKDSCMVQDQMGKRAVLESNKKKLFGDFEFNLNKTTMERRPDLILEDYQLKNVWLVDIACPIENNIDEQLVEKL